MRRLGLKNLLGFAAALAAAGLVALGACGAPSQPDSTETTTVAPNEDPREGRVYYDESADGEVIVVDGSTIYLYSDICNADGELVRSHYRGAGETLPDPPRLPAGRGIVGVYSDLTTPNRLGRHRPPLA